jgi:hypothetical protein
VNYYIDDFIGVFENAFDKDYCERVIELFGEAELAGITESRVDSEGTPQHLKDDSQLMPCGMLDTKIMTKEMCSFLDVFWRGIYPAYLNCFSALKEIGEHRIYSSKVQKTKVGGGYHVWHSEKSREENRVLAYLLYLNDVEEGGETEFLYQHKRIKPKQGTLVLWPAGFTHTHRGNPPLSNTKYIMTGWVEY